MGKKKRLRRRINELEDQQEVLISRIRRLEEAVHELKNPRLHGQAPQGPTVLFPDMPSYPAIVPFSPGPFSGGLTISS